MECAVIIDICSVSFMVVFLYQTGFIIQVKTLNKGFIVL